MKKIIYNEENMYRLLDAHNIMNEYKKYEPFVDLVITSPPYWNAKDYGGVQEQMGYKQTYKEYLSSISQIFKGVYYIAKNTASLYLIIDTIKRDNNIIRLPDDLARELEKIGWCHQDTIIWDKVKTLPWSRKGQARNIFEYILVFTKNKKRYTYNDDSIKLVEPKGWWKDYPERYSPTGTNPSNIWEFAIPAQGSWGKRNNEEEVIKHACPFPPALVERIIKLSSNEGDLVFDPFAGSGVELSVAEKLNRRYLGLDVNSKYRDMFVKATQVYVNLEWSKLQIIEQQRINKLIRFSDTIIKLRSIKYGKILLKKLISQYAECTGAIIYVDTNVQITKRHVSNVKGYIVVDRVDNINKIESTLNEYINKPPLSKYGVSSSIKVVFIDALDEIDLEGINYEYNIYRASETSHLLCNDNIKAVFEGYEINKKNDKEIILLSNVYVSDEDFNEIE